MLEQRLAVDQGMAHKNEPINNILTSKCSIQHMRAGQNAQQILLKI